MQGFSPLTGEPLRPAGSNGTRVAGVELMFAPPKSVSALWAVSGPYRRAQIEAAHQRAVASTLARIEREVALVRRKSGGVVRFERAKSLLAAEFVHTTSRLAQDQEAGAVPDPQVHSHLVLFAAERIDGRLAAIESRQLYRSARQAEAGFGPTSPPSLQSSAYRSNAAPGATGATSRSAASPRDCRAAGPLAPKTSTAPPASSASATGASQGPKSWAR